MRGQYRGYREEPGVAPDSAVETFAALQLHVDSWRWAGVPFFIRAGKRLAATATEVRVELEPPAARRVRRDESAARELLPLPPEPDVVIALGARAKRPGEAMVGEDVRARRLPRARRRDVALRAAPRRRHRGDPTLFAREDGVEAAWRIVDPVLAMPTPVHLYEPGSWGPREADGMIAAYGGWDDPIVVP